MFGLCFESNKIELLYQQ